MSENLRDKVAETLRMHERDGCWDECQCGSVEVDLALHQTDAVLAVVGPELDRLRAEVETLIEKIDREAYRKGVVLRRAKDAEAERDVLRARLAKVEALADEWATDGADLIKNCYSGRDVFEGETQENCAKALRAALASAPEPSDSEPAPRPSTPPTRTADGRTHMTVHRSCNGCGRDLGDANDDELNAAVAGHALPDVRRECGCDDSEPAPCRCHNTHAAITARREGER